MSTLVTAGEPVPDYDLHSPLLSMPLAFGTRLDTIPSKVPYLSNDPARIARWRDRVGPGPGCIGLVWSGRAAHGNDHNRSLPFSAFCDLLVPGARYFGLQPEIRSADRSAVAARRDVAQFGPALADAADTAAVIAGLDLVITVDTFVAHLAGALGKPVWILLPWDPDWRWLLERTTSPWYPSATLFRQSTRGDWSTVLTAVRERLVRFLG